jgi:hypothetical protein
MKRDATTDRTDAYLSAHGRARAQQRGMPGEMVRALAALGDRVIPVGGSCIAIGLSRQAADEARAGGLPDELVSRLRRRTMVIACDGTIVTLLVNHRGRGRRYSRGSFGTARDRARGRRR